MSTNELREAAERFRRLRYQSVRQKLYEDFGKAATILADAYLAEHPADDDTPADDEWLYVVTKGTVWLLKWNVETREVFLGETSCGVKKTKGQWRELLRALGITLKEKQ